MTHPCERCSAPTLAAENEYGEFVCEDCEQNAAEAAWERHCEDFHDGGSTTWAMIEAQRRGGHGR